MNQDVQQLLDSDPAGLWVDVDVVMEALGVGRKRVYQLRKSEGWRTHGKQINFQDVARTWHHRKDQA